ncbi:MAG: 2-dehydropantoate 2-reductase [Rubrivivax sp.]|jgi:2-dehydropantoate 2-reductase|nr:2-dehydropantoate 2-reductase [Rubrivivax sp.]
MTILVMGAGAVGSWFGGLLARAGHEVALVARPAHVEAIRRGGLRLESQAFDERVRVAAHEGVAAVRGADLVLLCVKATDTEAAAASLAPTLADGATVLSLQNGVDNAERAQRVLGRPVTPAVVYVAVELAGPGHVRHHGRGELVMPDDGACARIAPLLRAAGIPVHPSADILGALWAKLIVNCACNPLSAIARLPFGPLLQGAGVADVMRDVVAECQAVARVAGIVVPGDPEEALRRTGSQSGQYASMAQDLMHGRRTEIDHLNGHVVRLGSRLGVPTPVNRTLHALVSLLEAQAGNAAG